MTHVEAQSLAHRIRRTHNYSVLTVQLGNGGYSVVVLMNEYAIILQTLVEGLAWLAREISAD